LRSLGGDLGSAIKGFKKAMKDDDSTVAKSSADEIPAERVSHKE
jgi:Sec-independent protein translocase protein TatE